MLYWALKQVNQRRTNGEAFFFGKSFSQSFSFEQFNCKFREYYGEYLIFQDFCLQTRFKPFLIAVWEQLSIDSVRGLGEKKGFIFK